MKLVSTAILTPLAAIVACVAFAAPPYNTDDPEPAEYKHFEVYFGAQFSGIRSGYTASAPLYEINYGGAPNLQLSITTQMSLARPFGGSVQYGVGDTNLGAKFRFVQETKWVPQVSVFPALNVPCGDSARGLGEGKTGYFLPVWAQKSRGPWILCGGGGFWSNPGVDLRNYWFTGVLLTRQMSKKLTIGAELFNTTQSVAGEGSHFTANFGAWYDLDEGHHLLGSVGSDIHGSGRGIAYFAYGWTWGPKEEHEKAEPKAAEPKAAEPANK